jgi:hypothetical protein
MHQNETHKNASTHSVALFSQIQSLVKSLPKTREAKLYANSYTADKKLETSVPSTDDKQTKK